MGPNVKTPERYQQAEWIVSFVTDAGNHGRSEELADAFQKSLVSFIADRIERLEVGVTDRSTVSFADVMMAALTRQVWEHIWCADSHEKFGFMSSLADGGIAL
jgi:hypothetical protein